MTEKIKKQSCEYYKKCGGCQLRNLPYADQLKHKQINVIKLLGRFCRVDEIIGMDDPARYRFKASAAFQKVRGVTVAGIYRSSEHRVVNVRSCPIQAAVCDRVLNASLDIARELNIGIFDENRLKGGLRHVQVRAGYATGQVLVVAVTGERNVPLIDDFARELKRRVPEVATVVQNVNGRFTNMILGEENITLLGQGYIEDELLGMTFRISPGAFYQVNPKQTEKLYSLAVDALSLTGAETVVDAYCGTGTIGLIASAGAKKVVGVESSRQAVGDARVNARINSVTNAEFICADAGEYALSLAERGEVIDALIMDPPRNGSDKKFLSSVCALAPKRVVYVSCNPETLARDLQFLTHNGYKAKKITPVDMFPYTEHVETVVRLSRSDMNS